MLGLYSIYIYLCFAKLQCGDSMSDTKPSMQNVYKRRRVSDPDDPDPDDSDEKTSKAFDTIRHMQKEIILLKKENKTLLKQLTNQKIKFQSNIEKLSMLLQDLNYDGLRFCADCRWVEVQDDLGRDCPECGYYLCKQCEHRLCECLI